MKFKYYLQISSLLFCSLGHCSTNPVEQLNNGNIDELENYFSQLNVDFNAGKIDEYSLFEQYKIFYLQDEKHEKTLNEWIEKYPKSDNAYLARGIYYRKLGEYRRGYKFANNVTNSNMNFMFEMYNKSEKDLVHALDINKRSYISALNLLNIDQYRSDAESAKKHLLMANMIYPQNMMARCRYLLRLTPRWGGDYNLMENFIQSSKEEGLSSGNVSLLTALKYDDMGDMAQINNNPDLAEKYYEKALNLSQSGSVYFRTHYLKFSLQLCSIQKYKSENYCSTSK